MDRIYDAYNGQGGFSPEVMRKTRERLHWICSQVWGSRVLDVGCSQGVGPVILARMGYVVDGIDINPEAIAFANDQLTKEPADVQSKITYAVGDFGKFVPPKDKKYDVITMSEVLEHLVRPQDFVRRAYSVLPEKGRLIVTVPFGIMDDPDHRQTFYLASIYSLLHPLFEIASVKILSDWIGLVGRRRAEETKEPPVIPLTLIRQAEEAFFKIERPLRDGTLAVKNQRLELRAKQEKLAENLRAAEQARLEAEVRVAAAEATPLRAELADVREQLSASEGDKQTLQTALEVERKVSAGLRDQVSMLKAMLQFATSRPQDNLQETRLLEYSQEVRDLRSALDLKRDEAISRAEQYGRLAGRVEYLEASNKLLVAERETTEKHVAELESAVAAAKDSAASELAQREKLAADMSDANRQVEAQATRIKALESELADMIKKLQGNDAALAKSESGCASERKAKQEALSKVADLAKQVDALKKELVERLAEQTKLREENVTLSGRCGSEEKSRKEITDRANDFEKTVKRLNGDLAKTKAKLSKTEKRLDVLSKAKLCRLTLKYWKLKDAVKGRFAKSVVTNANTQSVSVIIPTYRENPYLEEAVRSVLNQDYPADKLVALVCVNGPDREYYKSLSTKYAHEKRIQVLYTSKPGLNSGRNLGISKTRQDLFAFLDDDDVLTVDYISSMSRHFVNGRVNIAVGKTDNYDAALQNGTTDTYINQSLRKVGAGETNDYWKAATVLSNMCGKLFRTSFFKSSGLFPLDEVEKRSEDILFWSERFNRLDGLIYIEDTMSKASYCRRVHQNSLSRPSAKNAYRYWITDGIRIVERLGHLLSDENIGEVHKLFVLGKLKSQVAMIKRFYDGLQGDDKTCAFREICASPCPFFNKSLFASRRAIAFCHNFPPFVDASSFVASKRLLEIDQKEGAPLDWHVFAQNMCTIRTSDQDYVRYFVDLTTTERQYCGGSFAFVPKGQMAYAEAAFKWADPQRAEVIYSRSMFVGGHIAASMYKKAHPEVKWYAEFSDPPAYGVDNMPRACNGTPTWLDIEQMVYENADVIIFTNSQQREYMLSYNPRKDLNERVMSKSLVMHHPVISHEYCGVKHYDYALDEKLINIGFFGTFYANRKADDLLSLLENPKVVLHVFTSKPDDMSSLIVKYGGRLRVSSQISHFEFLNLGSRMDYLVLTDAEFSGKVNPFLPSKYADYLVTGTPIIAKVQSGSPLSHENDPRLIKVSEIEPKFAQQLRKQRTATGS